MSHFTVLVMHREDESIEDLLAPFQENNMGDCPAEYMEFDDRTEEVTKEYETETEKRWKSPTGELFSPYDKQFQVLEDPTKSWTGKQVKPADYEEVDVPLKEIYKTLEDYAVGYHCYEQEEDGRFGYWSNPNAKWDWYQVGGRWRGFFKAKDGAPFALGESGVGGNEPMYDADSIRKGDIDFEAMVEARAKIAAEEWDFAHSIIDPHPPFKTWNELWTEYEKLPQPPDDIRETIRPIYDAQPAIQAWNAHPNVKEKLGFMTEPGKFRIPRDEYIKLQSLGECIPYAILHEGEWYQRGEMGWFGMASNEKDMGTWEEEAWKLIQSVPDDTLFTIVDCHI